MTEFDKMLSGQLFDGSAREIQQVKARAAQHLAALNCCSDEAQRQRIYATLFKQIGEGSMIASPFLCEFGRSISVGSKTFINMNCTMLDGAEIVIGNHVLIGPNTQFYTPSHPLDHLARRRWETRCLPIVIEDDVWIGGNVVINQGLTIGARSVIAVGSVVNHDVPSDSLYGGTPAKLIRSLLE